MLRRRMFKAFLHALAAVALWLAVAILPAGAHADLLLQIEEITKQLQSDPTNIQLLMQRGELRRAHLEWDDALADFNRVQELNPSFAGVDLARGRLMSDAGWLLSARAYLDRYLARESRHAEALASRARVLARLQLNMAAAEDFSAAIQHALEPGPELFLERAQAWMAESPTLVTNALQGLDEGLKKIGSLVTLQLMAVDLEMKRQNYDGALARVDQIAARSPRKESWLARRGEILSQAGRPDEARQAFQSALAALATLPPVRRNVPAMQQLEKRIQDQIKALPPSSTPKS